MQVVDHDQPHVALRPQPARLAAHLEGGDAGSVVHEDRSIRKARSRLGQPRPLIIFYKAPAQAGLADPGLGAQQTLGHLVAGHLQAEDQHRDRHDFTQGGVPGNVQGKGGLSHGRPGRQQDQVARLQAASQLVQVFVTGGQAGNPAAPVLVQPFDPLQGFMEQFSQGAVTAALASGAQFQHHPLRLAQQLFALYCLVVTFGSQLRAGADDRAQQSLLGHDSGVIADVDRGGHRAGQGGQVAGTPHLIK